MNAQGRDMIVLVLLKYHTIKTYFLLKDIVLMETDKKYMFFLRNLYACML
jgi:hypothetical protein